MLHDLYPALACALIGALCAGCGPQGGPYLPDSGQPDSGPVLAAIPVVGPVQDLDLPVVVPQMGNAYDVRVAYDGQHYLSAFYDPSTTTIRGGLLDPATGALVGPGGFTVAAGDGLNGSLHLSYTGQNYLLVWLQILGTNHKMTAVRVVGLRLNGSGTPIDSAPFIVLPDFQVTSLAFQAGLSCSGQECLLAWSTGSGTSLHTAKVTAAGQVTQNPLSIPGTIGPGGAVLPYVKVTSLGPHYLITWASSSMGSQGVLGVLVSSGGMMIDGPPFQIAPLMGGTPLLSGLAAGQCLGTALVAWAEASGDRTMYRLRGTRVDGLGRVLDPGGIVISAYGPYPISAPAVTSAPGGYQVAWTQLTGMSASGVFTTQVSAAGHVAGAPVNIGGTNPYNGPAQPLALSQSGDHAVLAYSGTWPGGQRTPVRGVLMRTADGAALNLPGTLVNPSQNAQSGPRLAFGAGQYLAVWTDDRGTDLDIYGARLSPGGAMLDPQSIAISTAAGDQQHPAVTFDGRDFVVAWEDGRAGSAAVYAARVSPTGQVLDQAGIAVAQDAGRQHLDPALASDGLGALLVYTNLSEIRGVRLSQGGGVIDGGGGYVIGSGAQFRHNPLVRFGGQGTYLVAWEDSRNNPGPAQQDLYFSLVGASGSVASPGGRALVSAGGGLTMGDIAAGMGGYLVVYSQTGAGGPAGVAGVPVSSGGVPAAPFLISSNPVGQQQPTVAWSAPYFVVSWADQRKQDGSDFDVYAARVLGGDGRAPQLVDPAGFEVDVAGQLDRDPVLACDGSGGCVSVFARLRSVPEPIDRIAAVSVVP